jgi:hypothetical protein
MINVAIGFLQEDRKRRGIVVAGDRALSVFRTPLVTEGSPIHPIEGMPAVFARAGGSSAIAMDFHRRLREEIAGEGPFTCEAVREKFHKIHSLLSKMAKFYYEDDKNASICMDFILAGSDPSGDALLYYAELSSKGVCIEDILATTGYAVTLSGSQEGILLLKGCLDGAGISERVALETAVFTLLVLSGFMENCSGRIDAAVLKNGEVGRLPDEALEELRMKGFLGVKWRALLQWLRDSLADPRRSAWSMRQVAGWRAAGSEGKT